MTMKTFDKIKIFSGPLWGQIGSIFDRKSKRFRIRILDMKYLSEADYLGFKYLTYEVMAEDESEAILKGRKLYMTGQKEDLAEELPILLKIVSANECT